MPHFNRILDVLKRDHAAPYLLVVFPRREEVLEDCDDAVAELGREAFEDEVWVGFGDGAAGAVGNVGA